MWLPRSEINEYSKTIVYILLFCYEVSILNYPVIDFVSAAICALGVVVNRFHHASCNKFKGLPPPPLLSLIAIIAHFVLSYMEYIVVISKH